MNKLQKGSNWARKNEDDAIQSLGSLRNPISQNEPSEAFLIREHEKKLNGIFVKAKRDRLRDIFIQKMKRGVLTTGQQLEIDKNGESYRFYKFQLRAITLPDAVVHFVLSISLVVLLVLMWLTTLQQFNKNLTSDIDYGLVQAFKIACLVLNGIGFFLKCISRSFHSQLNQVHIRDSVKAYAKSGRLFIDLIMMVFEILTLTLARTTLVSALFSLFLIISLFYIVPDMVKIETAYLHSEKRVLIWGLVKVCFGNLVLAHILAGILLSMSWINSEDNWLIKAGIENQLWYVKYFYAIYWGTTIMMTVGFGDILPSSEGEIILVTFLQMFSCIVLGYNVSQIGHLVSLLRQKEQLVNKKLAIFDRMVKSRPITSQQTQQQQNRQTILYKSIYSHIQQLNNTESNLEYQRRNQFLQQLPEHLRKAYYNFNNRRIFAGTVFFSQLKRGTMERLAQIFQSKLYYAGEIILENKARIMILERGQIGLGYRKRGSTMNGKAFDSIKVHKTQKSMLMSNHFLNISRDLNYYFAAKNRSIVWNIHFDDFIQALQECQIDHQYYFSVYHKHIINQDEWNSVECPRCSNKFIKSSHYVYDCPKITYKPLKGIIIMKYLSVTDSTACPRRSNPKFKRNKYVKISSLKYQTNYKGLQKRLQIDRRRFISVVQDEEGTKVNNQSQSMATQPVGSSLPLMIRNQILDLIQVAMQKYETGFEEGFWNLEMDAAHNYQFYFPKQNASRLFQSEVVEHDIKLGRSVKDFLVGKFWEQVGFDNRLL